MASEPQPWWKVERKSGQHVPDAHGALFAAVQQILRQNARRRADDVLFMTMYGNRDVAGLGSPKDTDTNGLERLRLNLLASVVNTAEAHIASKRPKVKFQTSDADWGLVRKAQACEHAVRGVFEACGYYELARAAFRDACVSSLGALYVYGDAGEVRIERVFPGELLVDTREGYYGDPLTIYRVKMVDRHTVKHAFGLRELPAATSADDPIARSFRWVGRDVVDAADQVAVVTAHRLGQRDPKTGKRTGGAVCIAIAGKTLAFDDWDRERFPYAMFRWERRQFGFYGRGIVEELRGHQRAINYLDLRIADAIHKNSRSKVIVFDGTAGKPSVNVNHLTTDPADIIRVRNGGQAPLVVAQNAVPAEWFSRRREIIEDAYAQIGLSQLTATGQVPRGIESGVALREVSDAGSRRWQTKDQDYETLALDTGRLVVEEMRCLAEDKQLRAVKVTRKSGARTIIQLIDWSKVDLDEDQYEMQRSPASSLPDSTAGRTQTVQDWYGAGFITIDEAKQLLDFPDLDRFKALDLSGYELALDTIEHIIEDGEYVPPEGTDDLELSIKLATQSYNKFRTRGVEVERLELLLRYLDDLRYLSDEAKAAAAPQAAPVDMSATPPGAAPTAAPSPVAMSGSMPAAA